MTADSPLRRLRPECKVAATILFVIAVVSAPRETFWVYGAFAAILIALAVSAGLPLKRLARRLTIELPFVGFAVLLPFVSKGDRIAVAGLSLSSDGLWAAWNILAKGTLGVAATAVLAATTPVPSLLRGLDRLHLPKIMTSVAGFMVRYAEVLTAESQRMRIARLSRGYDPRWFWQGKAVATSAGTLFVRSFERGEHVYHAMLSRGFSGTMPNLDDEAAARPRHWFAALSVPSIAAAISSAAWLLR